jgi:simple sugar transport system ATP-binding protein
MVGRQVELGNKRDIRDHSDAETIMSIKRLWVDMSGETVRDVNLDIKKGEILGIGGLAGQGKLGIPNGIMGLCEAGGTVTFEGKEIPLNNPRHCLDASLAFVSEDRRGVGLLLDETLEWNVVFPAMQIQEKFLRKLFGGLIKWRNEREIGAVTQKYIEELSIKCTGSKQKAKELSGGNQQKICLAKAFALEPKFLFVSEPTRGIDVGAKYEIYCIINDLAAAGKCVVLISSELPEVLGMSDRIYIMNEAKIIGEMKAEEATQENIMAAILKSGRGS